MNLIGRLKKQFEIKIYHWVIMSNHYHLCVEFVEPEEMSKCMAGLQRAYTHYFNGTRGIMGYLWQRRFKSQAIEAENYLITCGRYIERNPVRAEMVRVAYQYKYSSAQYYCLGKEDKKQMKIYYLPNLGPMSASVAGSIRNIYVPRSKKRRSSLERDKCDF